MTAGCTDCARPLSSRNVTGLCRACGARAIGQRAEVRARISATLRRGLQADPVAMERLRARARAASAARDMADVRARCLADRIWEHSHRLQPAGSPARMRAGQSASNTRLAWCPPHLRSEYRHLTRKKKLPSSEARAVIEAHHQAEMERWRRGVVL